MNARRVALVTGAAGGIGGELCAALAEADYTIVAVDRHESGTAFHFIASDLASDEGPGDAVRAAIALFGRLDLVVHAAGVFDSRPTQAVTVAAWDLALSVNLRAAFFLAQAAIAALTTSKGSIINISSVAGHYPRADQAAYCASKAGLEHLTRVLAIDFAPRGVRVNAVRPGVVETGMARESYGTEGLARWAAAVPLGQLARPSDIAEGVLYLARARHVTGHVLTVDGGQTINFVRSD
jgi:NAD(P)-dependent dehydrogenase (short-subunit alcohol dehydrogenase family)